MDAHSAAYATHVLVSHAIAVRALHQMIEETTGTLTTEGFDHFIGCDMGTGVRREVALPLSCERCDGSSDTMSEQSARWQRLGKRRAIQGKPLMRSSAAAALEELTILVTTGKESEFKAPPCWGALLTVSFPLQCPCCATPLETVS